MYFKTFVSVAAVVAATSLPFAAHAQETHTLSPQFPDAFKTRTTTVSDVQITLPTGQSGSETKSSHGTMAWTTDTHKTADGYHGTIAIESINMTMPTLPVTVTTTPGSTTTTSSTTTSSSPTTPATADTTTTTTTTNSTTTTGPSVTLSTSAAAPVAGQASSQTPGMSPADIQQKITGMLKLIGNPELSYDAQMRPQRIDNLDALKANVKTMIMMASNAQNADKMSAILDLFLNDITPESAASFLRQSPRTRLPFGKPLALHTAVPLDGATFSLYGATLTMDGTATLDSWEDGKVAHLTMTSSAREADVHQFADTLVDAIIQKALVAINTSAPQSAPQPGGPAPVSAVAGEIDQIRPMIHKVIDNMTLRITQTCKVDVDLNDNALTQSDCATDVYGRIDPSKLMTDAQLKANPDAAAKLQAIVVSEKIHSVTTTTLVN